MSVINAVLGMELDPCGVQTCRHDADSAFECHVAGLMPAALLPYHPGEQPRADITEPGHRRGSGRMHDNETKVTTELGSGRYPLAKAWIDLLHDTSDRAARAGWTVRGKEVEMLPADAIAIAGTAAIRGHCGRGDVPTALLIPERCGTLPQQALLDAFRNYLPVPPMLIWRSVAAASGWLTQFEATLPPIIDRKPGEVAGKLLYVYAGFESIEIATVSLVVHQGDDGKKWYLPGRHRTNTNSPVRQWIEEHQRSVELARKFEHVGELWRRAWTGPGNGTGKKEFRDLRVLNAGGPQYAAQWDRKLDKLREELTQGMGRSGVRGPLGVMVCGALCRRDLGGIDLVELVRSTAGDIQRVVADGEENRGWLAIEAARLRQRVAQRVPAWLETLPKLDLVVEGADGEPAWTKLVPPELNWVAGGQEWTRSKPLSGFALRGGENRIELPLFHDEFGTVRRVGVQWAKSAPKTVPMNIDVRMVPAQGQARLVVRPQKATGSEEIDEGVNADWAAMDDTRMSPEAFLKKLPRSFPPPLPRIASRNRWIKSQAVISRVVAGRSGVELKNLYEALNESSVQDGGTIEAKQAKVFSSEGQPLRPTDRQLGEDLKSCLVELLLNNPRVETAWVVRSIAYTSASDSRFTQYLRSKLKLKIDQAHLTAMGHCFRDPESFRSLVQHAIRRWRNSDVFTNDTIKAIARILQYRPQASSRLSPQEASTLARMSWQVFRSELQAGNGQYKFRNAACLIGYLLRYRQTQRGFLGEGEDLTKKIRRSFALAYFQADTFDARHRKHKEMMEQFSAEYEVSRARQGHLGLISGQIDIPAALRQLLEYVDRKGSGVLQLGGDD